MRGADRVAAVVAGLNAIYGRWTRETTVEAMRRDWDDAAFTAYVRECVEAHARTPFSEDVFDQLAGGLEVLAQALPLAPGADDRGQLGIALVEPLGQTRVGVGLGCGELLLELGVLDEHALDGLEHVVPSC